MKDKRLLLIAFFVFSVSLLGRIVFANHIEYCHVEVNEILFEQNTTTGLPNTFCRNSEIKVKASVSERGLLSMPAEVELFLDGRLLEKKIIDPLGGIYVVTFDAPIPPEPRPKDPQINVTISAGCDPTSDSLAINYTLVDCPTSGYFLTTYKKSNFCQPIYTGDYRCLNKWIQRQRQNETCGYGWVDWKYCEDGCFDNRCLEKPEEEFFEQPEEETGFALRETFGWYVLLSLVVATSILFVVYYKLWAELKISQKPESF